MDPNSTTAVARLHAVQNHLSIQPCFQRHAIHNDKPTGPADLARERANASFKVEDMTEVILRGKENVEALVRILLHLKNMSSLRFLVTNQQPLFTIFTMLSMYCRAWPTK